MACATTAAAAARRLSGASGKAIGIDDIARATAAAATTAQARIDAARAGARYSWRAAGVDNPAYTRCSGAT